MDDYLLRTTIFKVLSDPIRLQIIDILSCGDMCACDILKSLSISQPTLSHHMKVLITSGLVTAQKKATWMHYSINPDAVAKLHRGIDELTSPKDQCICEQLPGSASSCDQMTVNVSGRKRAQRTRAQ